MPPNDVRFNQEVALDLCWLERNGTNRAALHIVDLHTGFSSAAFLAGQTVEQVWDAFLTSWATTYLGYPVTLRLDQGRQFQAGGFSSRAAAAGILIKPTGVESHNSLALGERYHAPLRRIYNKIRASHPSVQPDIALRLACRAMNDTMGPDGLVPTLLVFGALPRLPTSHSANPTQEERQRALTTARREYETVIAARRIREALRARVPAAAHRVIRVGDAVRVFREADGRLHGPYSVLDIDDKQAWLDVDGKRTQFNVSQLTTVAPPPAAHLINILHSALCAEANTQPDPYAGEPLILITHVLQRSDPRRRSRMFLDAIKREVAGLRARNTWTVVPRSALPPTANVMSSHFVLALKDPDTATPRAKARMVAGGHTDDDRFELIHDATTVRPTSIRLMLCVAAQFGWIVSLTDVNQAYLQSDKPVAESLAAPC